MAQQVFQFYVSGDSGRKMNRTEERAVEHRRETFPERQGRGGSRERWSGRGSGSRRSGEPRDRNDSGRYRRDRSNHRYGSDSTTRIEYGNARNRDGDSARGSGIAYRGSRSYRGNFNKSWNYVGSRSRVEQKKEEAEKPVQQADDLVTDDKSQPTNRYTHKLQNKEFQLKQLRSENEELRGIIATMKDDVKQIVQEAVSAALSMSKNLQTVSKENVQVSTEDGKSTSQEKSIDVEKPVEGDSTHDVSTENGKPADQVTSIDDEKMIGDTGTHASSSRLETSVDQRATSGEEASGGVEEPSKIKRIFENGVPDGNGKSLEHAKPVTSGDSTSGDTKENSQVSKNEKSTKDKKLSKLGKSCGNETQAALENKNNKIKNIFEKQSAVPTRRHSTQGIAGKCNGSTGKTKKAKS